MNAIRCILAPILSVGLWSQAALAQADTSPDAFGFTDQNGVALSSIVTSNAITVSGIDAAADISVTGGEYQVNSGSYTGEAGTVNNNDTVTVRHTSSASHGTATNTELDIGGVTDTFTSTTCVVDPVVTITADSGPGSLRAAVAEACADSTITFDSSLVNGTIALDNTNPNTQMVIDENLTIDGGDRSVAIQGSSVITTNSRIFYVNSGIAFTLKNLAVNDAKTGGDGAALYNDGGTVVIDNVTFSGSEASSHGGALYSMDGVVTLGNAIFSDNKASSGGSIYGANNTLTLTDTTISSSTVYGQGGGGLYIEGGTFNLIRTTISDNVATGSGAAGIHVLYGNGTITDTTISGNSGVAGGGIYLEDLISLDLMNTTVTNNTSGASPGGGIRNSGSGALTLNNSTVSDNSANAKGGGIYNSDSTLVLNNSTLSDNAVNNVAAPGGGIFITGGTALLSNVTIANNSIGSGLPGAGIYMEDATITLKNTLLANNTAGSSPSNCHGTISDGGYNLDDDTSCGFSATGSLSGTNPLVGTLGDYGGTTTLPGGGNVQTLPLLPGSPAIGAGDATTCADAGSVNGKDQRGIVRPQGTVCDIGAFESQGFTFTKSGDNQSAVINAAFADPVGVTVAPVHTGDPVDGGQVTFTAPASGASASLGTPNPATIASGTASVTATANATIGGYSVTAGARGVANDAGFSLTNIAADPVNGACGAAQGQPLTSAPSGAALCDAGTASAVSGSGPWTWTCAGTNGGTTASCAASLQTWTVSTSAGSNGKIDPVSLTVNHGATASFTVRPASGYRSTSAGGCGGSLSGTTYTTAAITGACTVAATFAPATTPTGLHSIPTLSEWMLLLSALLLAGVAVRSLRRTG